MSSLQEKIDKFYEKRNIILKKPLEKIINIMMKKCKYINGDSLERHNWGDKPLKLNYIPENISSLNFEKDLINALDLNESENIDKSIIELLWGDIQLGKRVQACVIMWISVHILKRPVLYIFRNLLIDQSQLRDDIVGTEKYNFNIQFIKNVFEEFNKELSESFKETNVDYWTDYKLPELKDISNNDIINKLSNRDAINSTDIFCCLMNNSQLEKLNNKFSEYIAYNKELVNITTLVDESDLMCPTSSNDGSSNSDKGDTTLSEILLAKLYKKVKYVLHITGTAHSLLYNITTRLSEHKDIQIKVSKVHKMIRSSDYYGLFNNAITFNTDLIKSWWDKDEEEDETRKNIKTNKKYNIIEDYNINIKNVINTIITRPVIKYNSLLISEEKIKINHFKLLYKILNDFPDLFIIIYHGKCLRLYLSKEYEKEIKFWAKNDEKKSSSSKRLNQIGGVEGSTKDNNDNDNTTSTLLPNNYCYFDIDTKILNIKLIYKLLRILFEKSETPIKYKTVITITGRFSERGYSFTSDDYDEYSFHLTDQYFVSHSTFNCTDISQRLRLQGKYNDVELKNNSMKLTLWTTKELQDVMINFYIKFIKEIEKIIMNCENWEDIKSLIEDIIDSGAYKFSKYIKYIDVKKKRKNIRIEKKYDKKRNAYKLILINDMTDTEIKEFCKENNFPEYVCINQLEVMNKEEFIEKYGIYKPIIPKKIDKLNLNLENKKEILEYCKKILPECIKYSVYIPTTKNMDRKLGINNAIEKNTEYDFANRCKVNTIKIINYEDESYYHLVGSTDKKILPSIAYDIKKIQYSVEDTIVKYSIIKEEYENKAEDPTDPTILEKYIFPENYYWKSPDGWLYLHKKDKSNIVSLKILNPTNTIDTPLDTPIQNEAEIPTIPTIPTIPILNQEQSNNIDIIIINSDIKLFVDICIKKTENKRLRIGIVEIYNKYKSWCETNTKIKLVRNEFKAELTKLGYKEETVRGIDIKNKPHKKGYNLSII
jgi:hypothetical protein